ncbi:transcriptional antiterminator [Virgibacillus halotolerans]|nr:PRD domain-containing protein [Virgibacillus halotolerans]MBM7599020.1 transcriptional antiterminator [Virgibacillus halotolerans]
MDKKRQPVYSDQNARIEKILYIFFSLKDYITASQLSIYLQVSRNTVMSDLNFLEQYIQPWKITLVRKSRIGYKLVGRELNIRLLFEHIIQRNLNDFDVYNIISQIKSADTMVELNYGFTPEIHMKFVTVIKHFRLILKNENKESISQLEILATFIRLTIFLVRMECDFTIGNYRLLKSDQSKSSPSSKFLIKIMVEVCEEYTFPVLGDEFWYIHRNFFLEDNRMNLLSVTEKFIQYVSKQERVPYYKDTRLYNNLLAHLSLRFEKGAAYVTEINPFINEIKQKNASLFSSVKGGFKSIFSNVINYGNIPDIIQDSFISFIALHFLDSYENVLNKKPSIRALYVCSTGRGVARLIKNRVEREIKNIIITTYCSVMEVDEISKNKDIDLIISMFPIKSTLPVIVVEPVPTEENIQSIKGKVNNLYHREPVGEYFTIRDDHDSIELNGEISSQEIIIKGFEISFDFFETLANEILEERKRGLCIHLFLMIHRYYFHKQYDQFIYQTNDHQNEELLSKVNEILHSYSININEAEQRALLQYFR